PRAPRASCSAPRPGGAARGRRAGGRGPRRPSGGGRGGRGRGRGGRRPGARGGRGGGGRAGRRGRGRAGRAAAGGRAAPGAAERELAWAGGLLFAVSGRGDLYDDEVPGVLGIDPADGAVVFQRRVGRPALLSASPELVAVVSGGRGSRGGMQVVAVQPTGRF